MQSFDFIILGSGMAGLTCAYILSKEGYNVCLLEKNRQFGGNLQTFSRDKRIFDTGLHYLGGLDDGQNLHKCFSYFEILDKIQLKKMDETGFDRISFHETGEEYKHAMGYENFIDTLSESFPEQQQEIKNYVATMRSTCDLFPFYNLQESKDAASPLFMHFENTYQYFEKNIGNEKLRHVLAGSSMLYAGDKEFSPFQQHALTINSYIQSAWRIVNGGGTLAQAMIKKIKENGGSCINYAEISNIITKNGKVNRVETKSGEIFKANHYISNIHPSNTFKMLKGVDREKLYIRRMENLSNGVSSFSVFLSLKKDAFPYLNHNYYHIVDAPNFWNTTYQRKDKKPTVMWIMTPPSSLTNTYADSMCVTTYMNYDEVAKWGNSYATVPHYQNDRYQEYSDFKEEKSQIIIDILAQKFPDFKSKIQSYYAATPLTFRDYIGTENGAMYGILKDYQQPTTSYLSNRTKFENLFLVGQNINHHGILGVTINAIKLCSLFLGESYLLDKINRKWGKSIIRDD